MAACQGEPRPLSLTVLSGPVPGECLSKPGAKSLKLGRVKTGNTFVLKVPSVSSKHAELVWDGSQAAGGGTWFLVDVGSSNGTQINGNSKCLEGAPGPRSAWRTARCEGRARARGTWERRVRKRASAPARSVDPPRLLAVAPPHAPQASATLCATRTSSSWARTPSCR
jgi:hypothetical protein